VVLRALLLRRDEDRSLFRQRFDTRTRAAHPAGGIDSSANPSILGVRLRSRGFGNEKAVMSACTWPGWDAAFAATMRLGAAEERTEVHNDSVKVDGGSIHSVIG